MAPADVSGGEAADRRLPQGRDLRGGELCDCGESVQREIVFRELARLYGTKYGYWYDLWLNHG